MTQKFGGTFTRRGPDLVTEELAVALFGKVACEFKPLFLVVYTGLRARHASSGGEEMMRLRVYEKLQTLVRKGAVDRINTAGVKAYQGLASLAAFLPLASSAETEAP